MAEVEIGPVIRPMRETDFGAVIEADREAFCHHYRTAFNRDADLALRSDRLLSVYRDANPGGAFVAESGGHVVGGIFTHHWGRIGWLGPFSVAPGYQGRGIGRLLLDTATKHLISSGATTVGLETMPESKRNLALYVRAGFQAESIRIRARGELGQVSDALPPSSVRSLSVGGRLMDYAAGIRSVCSAVEDGMDPLRSMASFVAHGAGDVIVAAETECLGVSLISWPGRRSEPDMGHVLLSIPSPESGDPDAVSTGLLRACLNRLFVQGCRKVRISAYAGYPRAVSELFNLGLEPESVCVRMVKREGERGPYIHHSPLLVFGEWAG